MKKMKKVISAILVLSMILTCFTGCGEKTTSDNNSGEVTELSIILAGNEPNDLQNVVAAIEEKLAEDGLNFKLKFTFVPSGQYVQKITLMAAGMEAHDLVWTHTSTISSLVSTKVLMPLNDALDANGKELKESVSENAWKQVTYDGNIYAIPRNMPMGSYNECIQIRKDIREEAGLEKIETVEQLDQYFAYIQKNYPDMVGMSTESGRFLNREYGNYVFPYGEYLKRPACIDPDDSTYTVKNYFKTEEFKDICMKMRSWMEEGYIPEDSSIIPDAGAALCSGKLGATWGVLNKKNENISTLKSNLPDADLEIVFLNPSEPTYKYDLVDDAMAVLSTSQHVNEAVALMNWVRSSQENFNLFSYGVEGVNYVNKDGKISYEGIPEDKIYNTTYYAWSDIRYLTFNEYMSDEDIEEIKNWDTDAVEIPLSGFHLDTTSIKTEISVINAVMTQYITQLCNYKIDFDKTYATFLEKLDEAGIEKMLEETQRQVNAYVGK